MKSILTILSQRGIRYTHRSGAATGYALAWLIGVPVPILIIVFLLRGCS